MNSKLNPFRTIRREAKLGVLRDVLLEHEPPRLEVPFKQRECHPPVRMGLGGVGVDGRGILLLGLFAQRFFRLDGANNAGYLQVINRYFYPFLLPGGYFFSTFCRLSHV